MNVVLAIALIAVVFMARHRHPGPPEHSRRSSACRVGLERRTGRAVMAGDRVVAVNGRGVERWQDVGFEMMTRAGRPVAAPARARRRAPRGDGGAGGGSSARVRRHRRHLPAGAAARSSAARSRRARRRRRLPARRRAARRRRPAGHRLARVRRGDRGAAGAVDGGRHERGPAALSTIEVVPANQDGKRQDRALHRHLRSATARSKRSSRAPATTWNVVRQTLAVLGKIFTAEIAAKSALSGPLEIASLSGQAARSGCQNLLYLMGFISIRRSPSSTCCRCRSWTAARSSCCSSRASSAAISRWPSRSGSTRSASSCWSPSWPWSSTSTSPSWPRAGSDA